MIRPVLMEVLLFLAPFAVYTVFLLATRSGVLQMSSWSPRVLAVLTAIALLLMTVSFLFLSQSTGEKANSNYVPPHMEGGKLVPGRFE